MVSLIRGAHVLTMGPQGDLVDAAVAVDGETIAAVDSWDVLRAKYPDARTFGDGRGIVLPGFVNAHGHFSEGLISGMGETMTLFEWVERIIAPVSRHLTRDMAHIGTLVKGVDMLLSGVTTVNDMFVTSAGRQTPVTPGVVDALQLLGLRGEVSFGAGDVWDPRSPQEIFKEHEALAEAAGSSRRCQFRLGIATLLLQSDPLFALSVERARKEGWAVHTHFHEVREEVTAARIAKGATTIEYAARSGLLDAPVLAAHCVWVSERDIQLLAQHEVAVAHNPVANMILASGVCPVRKLTQAGLAVGLGTDGSASNDSQNMVEVLKTAGLLQKVHQLDATAMTAPEVVRMATVDGARALRIEDRVGTLDAGKQADVILFQGGTPSLLNIHDPYQTVVYALSGREISDVWIGGDHVVRDGRIESIDHEALHETARELSRHLVTRAGLGQFSVLAQEHE